MKGSRLLLAALGSGGGIAPSRAKDARPGR